MSTSRKIAAKPGYHHGDLRRALVDAAAKIVAKEGAGAVTLREVARLAGVSHNAPYRHFESLEALLAAVAAQGFKKFRDHLIAAQSVKHGREISALGHAYVDFARGNPKLYSLMFGAWLDKAQHAELREASRAAFGVLQGAIGKTGKAGQLAAYARWALVHGLSQLIIDKQLALSDAAIEELLGG